MKKVFFLVALCLTLTAGAQIKSPQPSPKAKVFQTVGLTDITLEYSRPAMNEREIFGGLVPFDKLWRTGANENTLITFSDPVNFGGEKVEAGTYSIYTKPGEKEWEIMLYKSTNNWGTPENWDEKMVAARTVARVENVEMPQESWTMALNELTMDGAHLQMMWDRTLVRVPIAVPTEDKTMQSIKQVMSGPGANDYYQAAAYYLSADKDMKQAHEWISMAVKKNPKAFWMHTRKSLIEEKMGDKKAAIASARMAMKYAKESENADYVKINMDNLKKWGAM